MSRRLFSLLILVVSLNLSGCFLAPAIDAVGNIGFTKSDRTRLLPKTVNKYHEALYWRKSNEALTYVTEESRELLAQDIRKTLKEERIVESKVEAMDFSENGKEATVEVVVKYYKEPFYLVNERREHQDWQFNISDGWRISSRKKIG